MPALIIDTDPGVDDAFAIALACASPEVDLLGVTTVFGNVPLASTTRNARRLLALCGRADVPVAAGADRPLVHPNPGAALHVHGADGLSGKADTLPEPAVSTVDTDAVTLLARLLYEASEPVTIVPIGPLTNIALLLAAHPALRAKVARLVVMGGGLASGNSTAAAEFNLWSDPEAARRVLTVERVPCTLVPLDLTLRCVVDVPWLNRLAASGAVGAALSSFTEQTLSFYREYLGLAGIALHDAVAVTEAVLPGTLRTEAYPVEVDCTFGPGRGALIADRRGIPVDPEGARGVDVAVEVVDGVESLRTLMLDRLVTL